MIPLILLYASLVNDVRGLLARHDDAAAERTVRAYQVRSPDTPELAAALSWLARAALEERKLDRAESYASESLGMSLKLLGGRNPDGDEWLPTALGASIEVEAQALAAEGRRAEAIGFLLRQYKTFSSTSLAERIQKNVNLLGIKGKPATALVETDWLGPRPQPLSALRGCPVLLFFWAHWCPDCKSMAASLANIQRTFGPAGLVLMGPTRLYGFAAGGEPAVPLEEKRYIDRVRLQYYTGLTGMPVPVSAANFVAYGASTTPTLVLLDRHGIVRFYHPGAMPESELAAQVRSVLEE